jgi:nucleoside-diphosphate-sugar epimerase
MRLFGVLPEDDLESLAASFSANFRELKDVNFIVVGATGFLGKWISTFLVFLQSNSMFSGTLTMVIRDAKKLNEFIHSANAEKCRIVFSDAISKESFSHLQESRTIIIFAATNTSSSGVEMQSGLNKGTFLAERIVSALPNFPIIFVHLSSGGVYLPESRQLEKIPANFQSQTSAKDDYVSEKLALEHWKPSQHRKEPVVLRNPRLFAFYGPGLQLDRHFAIAEFMRQGLDTKTILIKGNPSSLRSYLYPTDAIKQIFEQCLVSEPIYSQVGSSNSVSILSVAQVIAQEFGVEVEITGSKELKLDNYVPQDVPEMLEKNFVSGVSLWGKWLKLRF